MTQPLLPIGSILGDRDACDHAGAVLSRCVGNNGIGLWCDRCRSWATKTEYGVQWLAKDHAALRDVDTRTLPEVGTRIYRRCQGACRQMAICEQHHMAPRAFFGDEADQWPHLWFCDQCHDRWHSKVTPGLCTAYDAAAHARLLIEYLGSVKLRDLINALLALWKARRSGAA